MNDREKLRQIFNLCERQEGWAFSWERDKPFQTDKLKEGHIYRSDLIAFVERLMWTMYNDTKWHVDNEEHPINYWIQEYREAKPASIK